MLAPLQRQAHPSVLGLKSSQARIPRSDFPSNGHACGRKDGDLSNHAHVHSLSSHVLDTTQMPGIQERPSRTSADCPGHTHALSTSHSTSKHVQGAFHTGSMPACPTHLPMPA